MSEWKKVKLGEVAESCLGKMLDAAKNHGEYQPYLANLNVRWGGFDIDNLSQMRFEEDENERYGIKYGDLIICEGGEPGRCAIWKEQLPNMKIQKALHRVRAKKSILNNFYLFYWFLHAGKLNWLDQYCTGATIKHLPGQKLKEVVIDMPPIDIQNRIATILSRYDSLIENYQKQIKLLEETAQRLYKEWFVDLRFLGHENAKIVDGVPEGWEKKTIGEIAEINKRNISKDYQYSYLDYTDLGNVRSGRIDIPTRYTYGDEPGRAKRIAQDGDIIWGMVRPNLKSYALVQYPKQQDVFSTGFAILTAKHVPFSFLYCSVITDSFVGYLVNCTNGAAYPAVKPEHFSKAQLVIPTDDIMIMYNELAEPMFRQVHRILSQVRLLTEARDRLLPKLMSGEISVETAQSVTSGLGVRKAQTGSPKPSDS